VTAFVPFFWDCIRKQKTRKTSINALVSWSGLLRSRWQEDIKIRTSSSLSEILQLSEQSLVACEGVSFLNYADNRTVFHAIMSPSSLRKRSNPWTTCGYQTANSEIPLTPSSSRGFPHYSVHFLSIFLHFMKKNGGLSHAILTTKMCSVLQGQI